MPIEYLDDIEEDITEAADTTPVEQPPVAGISEPVAPEPSGEFGGRIEYIEEEPLEIEPPRDNSWDTLRGFEVSMRQVPQLAYGVAGLVGETAEQLTGYGESLRDFGFKGYQDWAQSMEPISKETDDVTVAWQRAKEGDVGALVDWAQYGIGYALGQLGETAAVAVLGGIAGGAAGAAGGPTAVPAAAGGAVAAAAGKQGFKALAQNLVEKAIANQATKIVTKQAQKEGVELTAEQLAKRASQEAVKRQAGKEIGSNAAIFANAVGMQLGSIYGSAEEQARAEGRELTGVDLARIWGTGVATGGLEGVVDKFGLDLLKGKLSDKLPAGRLAGAAVAGGIGTVGEAATEAVQTVGERFGAGKDILSDEAINEYINASALGGLGGGAIGGVGGFISGNPKENAAAKAKVSSEANKDIAPASAETVARQADAIIAETVQETPEQRVARLQEEATAAAGIELEEEPSVSGFPPERIKSARWFESASRNRLKELQDKDEAGVEDFTTQETEEYTFLQSNPTPEQIAERYGYQVRTDVEPTIVTPTEPAAAPTPASSLLTRKSELDAEAKRLGADNISSFNSMYATRENLTEEQRNLLNQYGEYNKQVVELGWRDAAKLDDADFGRWEKIKLTTKPVSDQELTDLGKLYLAFNERGETQKAESVLKSIQSGKRKTNNTIEGWFKATDETLTQEEIDTINRENQDWNDSVDAMTEILGRKTPPEEISPTDIAPTLTPTPAVTPPVEVAPTPEGVSPTPETPNLEPLRRVARAEQTEEDVSGLVGQGLVELYNGQPVITQAGLETLPEAERPRLNPEARKIQIDTGSNEVVAEAIAKGLRIGVDQVGPNVTLPTGWTLDGDIYVPPAAPEARESRKEDVRLNPLGYDITTVVEDIKAGRTDGPLRAVNKVIKQSQELRDRIQREAARRQEPRARGKAAILDRLSRERAAGRISEETAQALTDFVNRIREDAIGDTALSIRKGGVSNFNFGETLVSFFLNQDQPATGARVGIHEFFHGLSRFLPDSEVEQMRQDYTKNLAEYLKKNPWFLAFVGRYSLTPEQFEEYKLFNPKEAETKLQPVKDRDGKIVKYQIKYDADNYRYIMLDEWIAEKMTDLVRSKQAVPNTFMGKIAKVIRDFLDLIKAKLGKDSYESFYQTITDPKQKLNLYRMSSVAEPFQIYQPQNFNYAEDVLDRIRYTRTERDPIITQAAMDLKEGKIDRDEYQRIVDLRMPLTKFENIPVPASRSDIDRGLGNRTITRKDAAGTETQILKRDLAQNPESISEGTIVESRLDIPAYENENVWVVSMHKPRPNLQKGAAGEVIAYTPTAVLRNVEFGVTEPAAINIATGKPKSTIATMKGSYVPMTAQQAYDLANRGRSEGWVEIGMNPIRHSYFYDKDTQSPVVSAEEVVQVGGMVLAKNPVYGKRDDYRFMALGGEEAGRFPTFETTSPEAATLSNMAASMAKVDAASEAKPNPENKPTYKISEIASVWMDQGGDTRQLQDMVVEYTNLTPANAKKVANAIAKQYDIQQSIKTAFLETPAGVSVEALPEGVTLPKEVDPDRPRPVMQRLFDVFMGVRVKPVKITGDEKALLKSQIRLKAAANRAAKQEQQRTADEVVEIIKSMELRGPVRPKQAQALAKRAAKVIWTSEKSMESFVEYAAKVVENANYDADLREAKAAQKRAKELSKQKKVAMSPQRLILQQIGNVAANKLDDPRMFAEMINYYLRGFKDVRSPDYVVVPDEEITGYISQLETESVKDRAEVERETNERLARKYDLDPNTIPELMSLINIIEEIEGRENREALESILTDKAIETQDGLRGYDTTALTNTQKKLVESMLGVDLKSINNQEKQMFIRIANNMIYNNQTNGAEYFVATAKGQQNARKAAQDSKMIQRNKAWIPLIPSFGSLKLQETLRNFSLELQSVADTFRNVFGKDFMAKAYEMMGMLDLNEGFTKANNTIDEIQDLMAEFHQGNEKTYGDAARNQDGILSEGVAGFLIQEFPFKDEATSIQQRRNLINEYIANARESRQKDRVAMADRVEAILNKVDGASVQEILNNMKREYRPNYDSLMWYKDVLFPKYKDFLKQFDENFNDQANNYDSPNYLPIAFTSAGPALALGPEDVSIANSISLQPKQSVYTIKRQDYTKLPKDKDGNPKEIEFNLRRAAFNSLSDQINKAYTNPAWQQIFAFMKTPESVEFFGDKANRDFFVDRLNRLRASRARRGSVSGGALEKALDSFSIISRKLGTGIALGGVFQWIKQPPDQLLTALGSGGRADLLAKNIAPSTQKAARELLNQFSIGRRGDSSAGYKYINQMEGHQSRMERYFSESKWEQAKEQGGKIADVWMVALKKSDFISASAAWMTYYEGELNKNDIKIDDWAKEAELVKTDPVRRQAAAYAEQMTDIYQGSSDPTSMATFAQSGKTGWENFTKALLVPFNSFAIQQRMRLYSDARDALNGTSGGKGGLAGTIGGLILFHTTKRFVLPVISGGTAAILYGMLGVDMEEPDEEKQKEMADRNWRQFLADITGNLLVGGTPQLVENRTIEAFNYASYMVGLQLESETVMDENGEIMSFDKYSKERSPFYRYKSYDNAMSLGMFDIGFDQAKETALQTKMLMDRDEMEMYTPEEQRLLYFSVLSEWLYLMRLNDTDFARIVKKARRDMIKAAEEREKELARIRAGR
jgi:hypothetical protein